MIDFRSDTVTKPTADMLEAMSKAPVGDDVFDDDPTVNELQEIAADMAGFDGALFTSSGTQANLLSIMSHCGRGDEYIAGNSAHNYRYEAGGAAVLGSIQPQPIVNAPDGSLPIEDIRAQIKIDDIHFAKTKLVSLENTIGGKVLPLDYQAQVRQLCDEKGLLLHLDGARVFNAVVKAGSSLRDISQHYHSMTICLSKGLGAPIGSLVLGDNEFIKRVKRLRKMVGGGMRQVGLLAAAGRIALEQGPAQLQNDHDNAQRLAKGLQTIEQLNVLTERLQTNILYVECRLGKQKELAAFAKTKGINMLAGSPIRFVTHRDVTAGDVDTLVSVCQEFYSRY